jgi:putative protease
MPIKPTKPELLAPAGDIDALYAAFDAGADAVYVGLTDFNARMRAKNFTVKTLSYLVPYAHARGKKVYVTLNILIKQAELAKCISILHQLDQIGVDAIIVQDLGVVDIGKRAFPRLKLHASTQMSIHNSLGAQAAQSLGLQRAVLARELTLREMAAIRQKNGIELEVFVHGALCYCFSGMCLASSFLGGSSGNRGRCTQVCRRPFETREGRKGQFFSPSDFCALPRVGKLMDIGVSSVKIEGRMKNEQYVFSVVSAYRKAIDDPGSAADATAGAESDLERKKGLFFLDGVCQDGVIDPQGPSGTGAVVGIIEKRDGASITVSTNRMVSKDDFVRIQPKSGFEGATFRVVQSEAANGKCTMTLGGNTACSAGDTVYLIYRNDKAHYNGTRNTGALKPARFSQFYPHVEQLMSVYSSRKGAIRPPAKRSLSIIIDDLRWCEFINPMGMDAIVLSLGKRELQEYITGGKIPEEWRKKLVIGLPYFIAESDIEFWRNACRELSHRGIERARCQNLGQWALFDSPMEINGGGWLWCFNRAAQKSLHKMGIIRFTYSPEDDFPNMQRCASQQATACLFGYVPLFISRIKPGLPLGEPCRDAFNNSFFTAEKDGAYFLLSNKPLCLFQKRKKLEDAGISSFTIDLSFCAPEGRFFKDVMRHYNEGTKVDGSGMFNFKLGIR